MGRKLAKATVATRGLGISERQIEQALEAILGSRARWKPVKQRESMAMITGLQGDQGGICVLPTAAGRSLLFMISAVMLDEGTSVVIVPFDALKKDLIERARDLGMKFRPAYNTARGCLPQAARMINLNIQLGVVRTIPPNIQKYLPNIHPKVTYTQK